MKAHEYRLLAQKALPEKRYLHTLEVEKEAVYLAGFFPEEVDTDALRNAALLHDITKYLTLEEHKALTDKELSADDLSSPETLHAKSGAAVARKAGEKYASAIESHTTGKPGMSLPEMILFIADYIEPTRQHKPCRKERELLHQELENGSNPERALNNSLIRILDSTVSYLLGKNTFIHPETIRTLNFYRGKS